MTTREAQIVEKIHKNIREQSIEHCNVADDCAWHRSNSTRDVVHLDALPNYRNHYTTPEDAPDDRGHVPLYSMRYRYSHPDATSIKSLRWPRFNPNRAFDKANWRKIERSYVRATQLTHRAWNRLSAITLSAIENCRITVYRKVYVPRRRDHNLELSFSTNGKLASINSNCPDSDLDYTDPSLSVIHDEQIATNIIVAYNHYLLAQRRCAMMQRALMCWVFPKYHAKEAVDYIDARGDPVTVIMVSRTDDCPIDRAYVMKGSSFEVKYPVFWPYGTLNVIE